MAGEARKYTAVGAGGALAGSVATSVFAFELFQKWGADKLLLAAQGTAAHVYALTAFCMIACIVLGTGYIATPSERLDARAGLFIAVTGVFLLAFVGGFAAIVFRNPSITAKFVVEDYRDQFLGFHDANVPTQWLTPYVEFPRLVVSDDENKGKRQIADQEIVQIGIENLANLEQKYQIFLAEDPNYHRDEKDLAQLCSTAPLSSSPACRDWRPVPTPGQAQ